MGWSVSSVSPEAVAEDLEAYFLLRPSAAREMRRDVVLVDRGGPFRFAVRVRLEGDVEESIGSVRAWFRVKNRETFSWKLGPHATPADLEAKLRDHGCHEGGEGRAMILEREPPSVEGVDVRAVESYEDYVRSQEILELGSSRKSSAEERAAARPTLPARFADYRDHPIGRRYLAFVDGKVVAAANAMRTSEGVWALAGGVTLPEARGRGAYRALVRKRWDDAAAAGTPALVTQASAMSRPILEYLGFRDLGPVRELIDTTHSRS
jgi:predicted GNAT family acetyltransferase